ncbi:hypothetical protein [Leptolyngbya sp. FACHB-261]|uniref:hypothetical protein n=1 Tax=Leptolyngbya sp. FACHB-261 TaxID=2692806 RepID=UPI001687E151|nr:hypothetical protein [Leptolyngbya sp. FACHB-261]MBD2103446.1 hypothetical protein [Leptolyngbya sp. FACHB-261]
MNSAYPPARLQERPFELQGQQKMLAVLQVHLEETEEQIESLQQLCLELQSKITKVQQELTQSSKL